MIVQPASWMTKRPIIHVLMVGITIFLNNHYSYAVDWSFANPSTSTSYPHDCYAWSFKYVSTGNYAKRWYSQLSDIWDVNDNSNYDGWPLYMSHYYVHDTTRYTVYRWHWGNDKWGGGYVRIYPETGSSHHDALLNFFAQAGVSDSEYPSSYWPNGPPEGCVDACHTEVVALNVLCGKSNWQWIDEANCIGECILQKITTNNIGSPPTPPCGFKDD